MKAIVIIKKVKEIIVHIAHTYRCELTYTRTYIHTKTYTNICIYKHIYTLYHNRMGMYQASLQTQSNPMYRVFP